MGSLARVAECGGGRRGEGPKMAAINVPAHFVSLPGAAGGCGCGRLLLLLPLMLFRQDEALKNALCDVSCGSIPAQVEAPLLLPPSPVCVSNINCQSVCLSVCLSPLPGQVIMNTLSKGSEARQGKASQARILFALLPLLALHTCCHLSS